MFRRRAAIGVACVVLALLLCAGAQTPPGSSPKTAEQVYKNIQVLKGIPADQLIPAMQFITESLGVGCDQCHVERAFENDDKKSKQTARQMIQMMLALNQNNFAGQREVTCYSCHRGSLHPARTPVVATSGAASEEKISSSFALSLRGANPREVFAGYQVARRHFRPPRLRWKRESSTWGMGCNSRWKFSSGAPTCGARRCIFLPVTASKW